MRGGEAAGSPADIRRLIINMERWRWMPEELGPLYVWGNTPEFMLYVIKNGKAIFADKTQVGTSNDPTPVFSADMTTIVFNPEWIAPSSVLVKSLLPRLRKKNYSILGKYAFSVSYQGNPVNPAKITNSVPPAISGTPTIGSTLTSSTGTFSPSPVTRTYQWMRGDEEIAGATARTYRVTTADVGSTLRVEVTASRTGLAPLTVASAPTPVIPENVITTTTAPAITGTPTVGSALTVSTGAFDPSTVTRAYQWNRDGVAIAGATARTYRATAADVDAALTVTLTVTKANYTTLVVTTEPTAVIAFNVITNTAPPTIKGTPAVGRTLSSSAGSWSTSVTKAYQWNRDGVPIAGATTSRYVLTVSDAGTTITVSVTATKTNYAPTTATSAPLAIP